VRYALLLLSLVACGSRKEEPPPAPKPTVAPDATPVDHCALITAEDLKTVCGFEGKLETGDESKGCSRHVGRGDSYDAFSFFTTRSDAARRFDLHPPKSERVDVDDVALGDRAVLVSDHTAMDSSTYTVHILRGDTYLGIRAFRGAHLACQPEQLVELGKIALSRLQP
jgi:hypothetical protein